MFINFPSLVSCLSQQTPVVLRLLQCDTWGSTDRSCSHRRAWAALELSWAFLGQEELQEIGSSKAKSLFSKDTHQNVTVSCGGSSIIATKWCCWEALTRTLVGQCNAPTAQQCKGRGTGLDCVKVGIVLMDSDLPALQTLPWTLGAELCPASICEEGLGRKLQAMTTVSAALLTLSLSPSPGLFPQG